MKTLLLATFVLALTSLAACDSSAPDPDAGLDVAAVADGSDAVPIAPACQFGTVCMEFGDAGAGSQ